MAVYNACGTGFGGGTAIQLPKSQAITSGNIKRRRFTLLDIQAAVAKAGGTLTTGDEIILLPLSAGEVLRYGAVKVNTPGTSTTCTLTMSVKATAGYVGNAASVTSSSTLTDSGVLIAAGKDVRAAAAGDLFQTANESGNAFAGATNVLESMGVIARVDTGVSLTLAFTGLVGDEDLSIAIEFADFFAA